MRGRTMLAVLFGLATLISISEGILFFGFGTVSPCNALSVQVRFIHEQAMSELGIQTYLPYYGAEERLQHEERQALGIPDPATPLHCVFALGKISSDYQGSVELAKNRWRPEKEQSAL